MNKRQRLEPVSADIETFSHDGRGIARINGKTTFIQGALPGEKVLFRYTEQKKDYDSGMVLEVLSPSDSRVNPRCTHYTICGGCSLQHLDETAQIQIKQRLLQDSLKRIGHVEPESMLTPLVSERWNYRNKARLSVKFVRKKQAALIGFRERNNPRYIAEITACPILHAKVDSHIPALRALIESFEFPEIIAQIEVAAGDTEVALIFRNMSALSQNDAEKLKTFAEATGFKLFLQPGGPDSVVLFYPEEKEDGILHYSLPAEKLHYQFSPGDFTQINPELNQLMIAKAMTLLDLQEDDVALDLFCGLGNFSLPMAKRCAKLIGIEGCEALVLKAQRNAILNGIDNAEFFCANLEDSGMLATVKAAGITKILLDPPRVGALTIVQQMQELMPQRIVYVSCNPATLARDADVLVNQHGYYFKAAGVMDMFPHTAHVESIAIFEKR